MNKRQRDTAVTIGFLAGTAFRHLEQEIEARERGDHRAAIIPARVVGEALTNLYKILRESR